MSNDNKCPDYVREFMLAVYPDNANVAMASFSEQAVLTDAAEQLKDLRRQLAAMTEAKEKAEAACAAARLIECTAPCADDLILRMQGWARTDNPGQAILDELTRLKGVFEAATAWVRARAEHDAVEYPSGRVFSAYMDAANALDGKVQELRQAAEPAHCHLFTTTPTLTTRADCEGDGHYECKTCVLYRREPWSTSA